ncbi:MAG: DUF937 domain-containing protein [Saprospiraceae bacterium]|nr:DUF937 domain-containing protein [Saprospiraceae bacterium]MBK8886416.1 DUF937 domain-containing protein [Saprospiraceae bacterium]
MDINDLLQGPMKDIIINQLGQQFGLGDKGQANTAVDGILATLLNGVANNASTPEGQDGLLSALDRDHDGSILNDLGGFLSGAVQPANPQTANGTGILNHILGDKQGNAVDSISKASGIDASSIMKMMATLAPVVLGMLGKARATQPQAQSGGGLLDLIKGATQTVNQQPTTQSIFAKLLDKDGDGNVMDDIVDMGMKSILGKFMGK